MSIEVTRCRNFHSQTNCFVGYERCDVNNGFFFLDFWIAWDNSKRCTFAYGKNPAQAKRRLLKMLANPKCKMYESL